MISAPLNVYQSNWKTVNGNILLKGLENENHFDNGQSMGNTCIRV